MVENENILLELAFVQISLHLIYSSYRMEIQSEILDDDDDPI